MTRYTAEDFTDANESLHRLERRALDACQCGDLENDLKLMLRQAARDAALVDALRGMVPRIATLQANSSTHVVVSGDGHYRCGCPACDLFREIDALLEAE